MSLSKTSKLLSYINYRAWGAPSGGWGALVLGGRKEEAAAHARGAHTSTTTTHPQHTTQLHH